MGNRVLQLLLVLMILGLVRVSFKLTLVLDVVVDWDVRSNITVHDFLALFLLNYLHPFLFHIYCLFFWTFHSSWTYSPAPVIPILMILLIIAAALFILLNGVHLWLRQCLVNGRLDIVSCWSDFMLNDTDSWVMEVFFFGFG